MINAALEIQEINQCNANKTALSVNMTHINKGLYNLTINPLLQPLNGQQRNPYGFQFQSAL